MTTDAKEKEITTTLKLCDNVTVFNYNLLHPKMLDIFESMLKTENNNNLVAIFISDTGPTDRYAEFCKHTKSMVISLPYIMEKGLSAVDEKDIGISLVTTIWVNTIHVFLHELHHNVAYAVDWELTDANQNQEEEEAQEYADLMLEELISFGEAEIPPLMEIPWFNTQIMGVIIEEIKAGQNEWAGEQKEMIDKELVFNDGTKSFISLREYFKSSTDKPELYETEVEKIPVKMETVQIGPESPDSPENAGLFDQPLMPGDGIYGDTFSEPSDASQEVIDVIPETGRDMSQEEGEMMDMAAQVMPDEEEEPAVIPETKPTPPSGGPIMNPFGNATNKVLHTHGADGHYTRTEIDPKAPEPIDHTEDGQPIYGSREDMMKSVLMNPGAHMGPKTQMGSIEMLRAIYVRLHNHIFTNCGFKNGPFTNPGMVYTAAGLSNDEMASGMIIGSYTINNENQPYWEVPKIVGSVRGRTFKDGTLPGYDLLIQRGNQQRKIRMVAQNPNTGKPPALRALAGAQITWIIDQDATNENDKWIGRVENGKYICNR